MGRTKVFLRAGQIGILDARRAEVLDNAAKCIQRRLRTYHARKDFLLMRSTALALQAYCRGHYLFPFFQFIDCMEIIYLVGLLYPIHISVILGVFASLRVALGLFFTKIVFRNSNLVMQLMAADSIGVYVFVSDNLNLLIYSLKFICDESYLLVNFIFVGRVHVTN